MPSPFPGMDPYLEQFWRDVHTSLIVYSRDQLQSRLPRDLLARVEEGVSVDYGEAEPRRVVKPDVRVSEEPTFFESGGGGTAVAVEPATAVLAEPLVVAVEEPLGRHVEVVDASSGNRVVTAIEFLSPTNKIHGYGREAYLRKRHDYLAGGVNLVEIDLVRQGEFTLAVPAGLLPARYLAPYLVCVRRAARPGEAAVYRAPLRERLPAIPIPLRATDRDVALELQPLIEQCYERGRYDRIDYSTESDPPLGGEDAVWAAERLRSSGRRGGQE